MATRHKNDLTEINLRKFDGSQLSFRVFVTTFLGFGANEARRRYVQLLLDANKNASQPESILDNCMPHGLKSTEHGATLSGTGRFDSCIQDTVPLLNKELPCPDDPCFFNGVHVPLADFKLHKFLGVSEFWYTSFDVYQLGGVYSPTTMLQASKKYCESSWDSIQSDHVSGKFPHVHDISRLQAQCFKSAWLLNILHKGFGFPKESMENPASTQPMFETINDINNFTVSWTLGAMLLQVSEDMYQDHSIRLADRHMNWQWGLAFLFFISTAIGFSLYYRRKGTVRSRWSSAQDLYEILPVSTKSRSFPGMRRSLSAL